MTRRRPSSRNRLQPHPGGERIQKVLARAGLGSRRHIEGWIRTGRITVNGQPARIGQKIGASDRLCVDNRRITLSDKTETVRVLLYKKRVGEVVTRSDPDGRRTVFRKLPKLDTGRWIAVGRLDINTSGLLLLTNSGELARRLMHPSFEIEREYAVRVRGRVDDCMLERLQKGVPLEDGTARFEKVWCATVLPPDETGAVSANHWFQVIVKQGRHRLVRKLWESQRCQVSRLIRVRFGPIELGRGIKASGHRELEPHELQQLCGAVNLTAVT
ncbi:MAG: rRNA pseudouridine synthase [Nevskiales bacterium]|nr:rRNA pseudouridine synthase [Nevskiales bacterium]